MAKAIPGAVKIEQKMSGQCMFVRVLVAAVLANGLWGVPSLRAAEKKPPRATASQSGYTQRSWCLWKNGGLDKDVARAIGDSNVGDKVILKWFYDERARAVGVRITSHAKPKPAEKEAKSKELLRQ